MVYNLNNEYYLRAFRKCDLNENYFSWFENQEVCKYNSHGVYFYTQAEFNDFYESIKNKSKVVFSICHIEDGHIGNASLQAISTINRTAEFAILIGNINHFGRGIGKLTLRKLIYHGFGKLNLNRIYCGTSANNLPMQKLALWAGMHQEGCRKEALYENGIYVDLIEYGITRAMYNKINNDFI